MSEVFFDPKIEISISDNSQKHISKVLIVSPFARNGYQSWTFFIANALAPLLLPYVSIGQQQFRCKNGI
jgi:hypothetical protein